MPELPEVESVRRSLVRAKLRAPVASLWRSRFALRRGELWRPENLDQLVHCRPGRLWRRGKLMLWAFESEANPPCGLMIHLGMSGRLGLGGPADTRAPHTHLVVAFADGRELRFVDPRRFGALRAGNLQDLKRTPPWSTLGPEPLAASFTGVRLRTRARRSRRAIRDVLLDQTVVAGVGNIYAVEALFEAGIHPARSAESIVADEWEGLAQALRLVLRRGLMHGGTTLRDFRNLGGEAGQNQHELRVYGRENESCSRCGGGLRRFTFGGRSGAYCPHDQV